MLGLLPIPLTIVASCSVVRRSWHRQRSRDAVNPCIDNGFERLAAQSLVQGAGKTAHERGFDGRLSS
jgi:hypothetical protein